jgi:PPE-repeat protein
MIYQLNGYNVPATYYVADQATLDAANAVNPNLKYVIGTQADAQTALTQKQADVLAYEAVRFSVCATFVDGNNSTWREVQSTDPEDTVCQVFNTYTGQYTQYPNKTEANATNSAIQLQFLTESGLDKLVELADVTALPKPLPATQPKSTGTQTV